MIRSTVLILMTLLLVSTQAFAAGSGRICLMKPALKSCHQKVPTSHTTMKAPTCCDDGKCMSGQRVSLPASETVSKLPAPDLKKLNAGVIATNIFIQGVQNKNISNDNNRVIIHRYHSSPSHQLRQAKLAVFLI